MMKNYEFIDELTYADFAFNAYGKDLSELFMNAALATTEAMVSLDTVDQTMQRTITLSEDTAEKLLYALLEEIVMLKDSEQVFFSRYNCSVTQKKGLYHLVAQCHGEPIDYKNQEIHTDVKAVTYHEFRIEQEQQIFKATVILDV